MFNWLYFREPGLLPFLSLALLPIVIHLLKIRARVTRPLPTFIFLNQVRESASNRLQIRELISLLLKILALLLLLIGFARPVTIPAKTRSGEVLVILDDSLSMKAVEQNREVFEKGLEIIRGFYQEIYPRPTLYLPISRKKIRLESDETLAGLSATHLPDVPDETRDLLHTIPPGSRVILISDAVGAGWSHLDRLPSNILAIDPTGSTANPRAILEARPVLPFIVGGSRTAFRTRIRNTSASTTLRVKIPPEREYTLRLTGSAQENVLQVKSPDEGYFSAEAMVDADGFIYDNRRYFVAKIIPRPSVLITANPTARGRLGIMFLKDALKPFLDERENRVDVSTSTAFGNITDDHTFYILTELDGLIDRSVVSRLARLVRQGKTVFVIPGRNLDQGTDYDLLVPPSPVFVNKTIPPVSFSVPIREDMIKPLSEVKVRGYFRWEELPSEYDSLITLANGDPLLLRRDVGEGTVYILTTPIHPSYTDLAINRAFVPLVNALVLSNPGKEEQYFTGDYIGFEQGSRIITPKGKVVEYDGRNFYRLPEEGIYRKVTGRGDETVFAVNVPAAEGDFESSVSDKLGFIQAGDLPPREISGLVTAHISGRERTGYLLAAALLLFWGEYFWYRRKVLG